MNLTRESFDATLNIEDLIVKISNVLEISDQSITKIYESFNKFGFVLIEPVYFQDFQSELEAIQKYFGNVIHHKRTTHRGISHIKPILGYPDYFGTTNTETGLHTDGVSHSGPPPKVMILQCEVPAYLGGESLLLSCKLLYNYLDNHMPEELESLFHPRAFSITRDNQTLGKAVFSRENERIFTIFRANGSTHVSIQSQAGKIFEVARLFTKDEKNILKFKLRQHQILVIDNTSVMHGRTHFPEDSDRHLNKIFLDGNENMGGRIHFGFKL